MHRMNDRATCLRIAAEAEVDPRTVAKFLRGERTSGLARARIERAARALGLAAPPAAADANPATSAA